MTNFDMLYPIPRPGVVGQVTEDEAVLVLPERGKVQVLNPVGSFIWTQVDGKKSVAAIVAAVCAEYAVEAERAQTDVTAFLKDLEARGVLILENQPA